MYIEFFLMKQGKGGMLKLQTEKEIFTVKQLSVMMFGMYIGWAVVYMQRRNGMEIHLLYLIALVKMLSV